MKYFVSMATALLLVVSAWGIAGTEETLEDRLKPAGEVCLAGDDCAVASAPVASAESSGSRSGADVYQAKCFACHGTGAGGAPKLGDAAAWAPRIAKGVDVLYASAINGLAGTLMMAKGGCTDCSDEEVSTAVDHIIGSSK